MAKIIMLHGLASGPKSGLISHLAKNFEEEGHKVYTPKLPLSIIPWKPLWINALKKYVGEPDPDTYLIPISTSCIAAAYYLNSINSDKKFAGIIMVTPFLEIDYERVKKDFIKSLKHYKIHHLVKVPGFLKNGVANLQSIALKNFVNTKVDLENLVAKSIKRACIGSGNDPYLKKDQMTIFGKVMDAKTYEIPNAGHLTGFYYDKFPIVKKIISEVINTPL